ncbi:carboxypeptidase-like regulatory domain-containing protein [Microgenomates group bacterium]|nr:carboxypeptidase-like regulatory domain-containing protein [Microgenomates group bacterium]
MQKNSWLILASLILGMVVLGRMERVVWAQGVEEEIILLEDLEDEETTDITASDTELTTNDMQERSAMSALAEESAGLIQEECPPVITLSAPPTPTPRRMVYVDSPDGLGSAVAGITEKMVEFANAHQQEIETVGTVSEATVLIAAALSAVLYGISMALSLSQIFLVGGVVQMLEALGIIKTKKEPMGMVFDSDNNQPTPFALLTVESVNASADEQKIKETLVTGQDGMYRAVELPSGMYQIKVQKEGYNFPSIKPRSARLNVSDFYRGEFFNVTDNIETQQMSIPLDAVEGSEVNGKTRVSWHTRWTIMLNTMKTFLQPVLAVIWILSILSVLITPTVFNIVVMSFYTIALILSQMKRRKRPLILGWVGDENQQPLDGVVLRLREVTTNRLVAVATADKKGKFAFFVKRGQYQITATKNNYSFVKEGGAMSSMEINASSKKRQTVEIKMKRVSQTAEDFFNS